jgi:hypothetical protein
MASAGKKEESKKLRKIGKSKSQYEAGAAPTLEHTMQKKKTGTGWKVDTL